MTPADRCGILGCQPGCVGVPGSRGAGTDRAKWGKPAMRGLFAPTALPVMGMRCVFQGNPAASNE